MIVCSCSGGYINDRFNRRRFLKRTGLVRVNSGFGTFRLSRPEVVNESVILPVVHLIYFCCIANSLHPVSNISLWSNIIKLGI